MDLVVRKPDIVACKQQSLVKVKHVHLCSLISAIVICWLQYIVLYYMGLDQRKPVFGGMRTTQVQTSLRIRTVWSAPFLLAFWKESYVNLLQVIFQFSS